MRKVNFHTLDNLTVPPALIEKALAIPTSSENTPAVLPWYRRSRMIAAAASIVLVVLAGISVFFIFGNNKIPVKPSGTSDVPIAADTTTSDGTPSADPTGSGAAEPHSERPTGTAAQSEQQQNLPPFPRTLLRRLNRTTALQTDRTFPRRPPPLLLRPNNSLHLPRNRHNCPTNRKPIPPRIRILHPATGQARVPALLREP